MYGEYSFSIEQKITLASLHLIILMLIFWLMFLNGIGTIASTFGFPITVGDDTRRILIILGGIIYFIRLLFTEFVFINREVKWSESLTIALWLFIIYFTFAFTGGTNTKPAGTPVYVGVIIYILGSIINTGSEYLRCRWKKIPEHKGKLYTGGFFKLSRHINYFGDVILFIGFSLFTGSVYTLIIPAAMVVLFVVVNIPMLDSYLHEKYNGEYEEYSKHTKKFVPYIY
jgi:protein-S-isoprenylcysteine O-methyltransferase Ste14